MGFKIAHHCLAPGSSGTSRVYQGVHWPGTELLAPEGQSDDGLGKGSDEIAEILGVGSHITRLDKPRAKRYRDLHVSHLSSRKSAGRVALVIGSMSSWAVGK